MLYTLDGIQLVVREIGPVDLLMQLLDQVELCLLGELQCPLLFPDVTRNLACAKVLLPRLAPLFVEVDFIGPVSSDGFLDADVAVADEVEQHTPLQVCTPEELGVTFNWMAWLGKVVEVAALLRIQVDSTKQQEPLRD